MSGPPPTTYGGNGAVAYALGLIDRSVDRLRTRSSLSLVIAGAAVAGLAVLPQLPWVDTFWAGVLTRMMIFAIFAMSLDLMLGYTGLPSLGHAAFFGSGAYTVAIFHNEGVVENFWVSLPLGIFVATAMAAIFGLLALRTQGAYFLMITLALAQVVFAIGWGWKAMTNGDDGIQTAFEAGGGLPGSYGNAVEIYYLILGFLIVAAALMYLVVRSPFGHALVGIRDSESRMRILGYNTWLYKYIVFLVSGAFAGLAGCLFAYYNALVTPSQLSILPSAEVLLMVAVGGPGTLFGPAVGAGFFVFLENFISDYTERWILILGIIFVLVVLVAPQGIFRALRTQWVTVPVRRLFTGWQAARAAKATAEEVEP